MVFVCIFAPSSSTKIGDLPDNPVSKDKLDKIKAQDGGEILKNICKYNIQNTKAIEMIPKFYPFKNLILTPASSVWIQVVSVTGMFLTGILLILYLIDFIAKFSKIPWSFFEMVFCAAMSFCYFTCGLDLFIKGLKLYISKYAYALAHKTGNELCLLYPILTQKIKL